MERLGRGRLAVLAWALTVISVIGLGQASIASAQVQRAGQFLCRGTGLRIGTSETGVANSPGFPCRTDIKFPLNVTVPLGALGGLKVLALGSATQSNPSPTAEGVSPGIGHGGNSQAGSAGVTLVLGTLRVSIGATRALGVVQCDTTLPYTPDPPVVFSLIKPQTVGLEVNNQKIAVNGPLVLPLGVLTLRLNQEYKNVTPPGGLPAGLSPTAFLVQRPLEINSPLLPTIVIGETIVGYRGNPCALASVG